MRLKFTTSFLLLLAFGSANAASNLQRLEDAHGIIAKKNLAFMTQYAPNVAKLYPDTSWDAEMREVISCYLDQIKDEGGSGAVDAYVAEFEQFAKRDFTKMAEFAEAPTGLATDRVLEANTQCGVADIAVRRMQESGYNAIYSDPELMKELTDLFQTAE